MGNGLFGPSTKNTTLRSIPPGLKRLGANRVMLVKEVERLRTDPAHIWIRYCSHCKNHQRAKEAEDRYDSFIEELHTILIRGCQLSSEPLSATNDQKGPSLASGFTKVDIGGEFDFRRGVLFFTGV